MRRSSLAPVFFLAAAFMLLRRAFAFRLSPPGHITAVAGFSLRFALADFIFIEDIDTPHTTSFSHLIDISTFSLITI